MKNYIGVKIVKARPGTMAEAQAMQSKCLLEVAERTLKQAGIKNREGYIVTDTGGKIEWMSKDSFNRTYRLLECEDFINEK